ncbi:hypothetical protein NQ318_017788 [Aromia moschata]|uniref:Uncharacterized protein n=1 Tax=Aromia moschata TaxID=1265417 RepID=A0AAV8XTV5_9CUCU|nr:hypothetical protein NQ318_017788 [Aromia moschata]
MPWILTVVGMTGMKLAQQPLMGSLITDFAASWSGWSEWNPCYHRAVSDMDSIDTCLCQTRQCNNPAPANNGKACIGPSVAVVNCTALWRLVRLVSMVSLFCYLWYSSKTRSRNMYKSCTGLWRKSICRSG